MSGTLPLGMRHLGRSPIPAPIWAAAPAEAIPAPMFEVWLTVVSFTWPYCPPPFKSHHRLGIPPTAFPPPVPVNPASAGFFGGFGGLGGLGAVIDLSRPPPRPPRIGWIPFAAVPVRAPPAGGVTCADGE